MGRHAIHLGSAWEFTVATRGESGTWRRWFHRPTGLGPGDRVFLTWERSTRPPDVQTLTLNGVVLQLVNDAATSPATVGWESDITALLKDRNELLLRVADVPAAVAGGRAALPESWGRLSVVIVSD